MSELHFVPVSRNQASEITAGKRLAGPLAAFCANNALASTFGSQAGSEEAEHAAALVAEVAGLSRFGVGIVLTCGVPETAATIDESEAHNGGVILAELRPEWVEAFFIDDAAPQLLAAAADGAKGLSVDDAWDVPAVVELLQEDALLWHDRSELALL